MQGAGSLDGKDEKKTRRSTLINELDPKANITQRLQL